MKNDNIKRVKGILSAKQGAEVPKFLNSGQLNYAKDNFITDTNFKFWCTQNNLPPSQENYIRYQKESSNTGDQKSDDKDITTKKSDFTVEVSPNQGLNNHSAMSVNPTGVTLTIPGEIPVTPTTSAEEAAKKIVQEQQAEADLQAQSNARFNIQTLPQSLNDQDKAKIQKVVENSQAKADAKNSKKIQQMAMSQDPEFMQQQRKLGEYGEIGAAGLQAIGSVFKANNAANNSNETNAVDSGVSAASGVLSSMGGTAGTVGKILGIADSAGQIIRGITGGTDQMTGADKFFDSGIGTILGGFINQIGAQKSDAFATDVEALETVGSSYGGTSHDISEAARKANKKYGLFSLGAMKKANEAAKKVAAIQNTMADVADTARDQRLAVQSMGEQAGLAYSMMADGGYNQKYTYAAKHGGLLEWNPVIELEWQPQVELVWELPTLKEGGSIDFVEELEWIPEFKSGGKTEETDVPETEETNQKNVIPEGALHKNKHHMEHAEGLTKKGIPVVDEDGEQQAEIEHSEIIFTLEVTKKLEEYYEIFYSGESTNKEKEQAALDAGKLLVYQILENTEDRTGLIESCKKGGTLNFKKDTEELIEEVLEWMPTIIVVEEEFKEEKPEKKEDKLKANKEQSDKDKMKEAIKEVLIELLIK